IEMDWVNTALANVEEEAPYILMVYVRGTSLQLISGSDVPAEAMITHAGGIDAGTDIGVSGYTPLNAELVLTSFPDYVLLMRDGVDSAGGLDFIKKLPGISQVPAGQNNQFIVIDDMFLLGMSTRTGYSLLNLAKNFFPTMTWELNVDYPYSFTDATGQEVVIEQEPAIIVTSDSLFNIVQNLGYHPLRIENMIPEGLVLATMNDDWQSLRDNG